MGWLTPKYPKSDTPGATAPAPSSRRSRQAATSAPAPSGMTADQLRGVAMHEGGRVEFGRNTAVVKVETKGPFGTNYSTQRYVKRSDGSWVAG